MLFLFTSSAFIQLPPHQPQNIPTAQPTATKLHPVPGSKKKYLFQGAGSCGTKQFYLLCTSFCLTNAALIQLSFTHHLSHKPKPASTRYSRA